MLIHLIILTYKSALSAWCRKLLNEASSSILLKLSIQNKVSSYAFVRIYATSQSIK